MFNIIAAAVQVMASSMMARGRGLMDMKRNNMEKILTVLIVLSLWAWIVWAALGNSYDIFPGVIL